MLVKYFDTMLAVPRDDGDDIDFKQSASLITGVVDVGDMLLAGERQAIAIMMLFNNILLKKLLQVVIIEVRRNFKRT